MSLIRLIILLTTIKCINTIVFNPIPRERGKLVIIKNQTIDEKSLNSGVNCIQNFAEKFFIKRILLTRSENILLTHIWNLTSPANEIQLKFIKDKNENVTKTNYHGKRYQIHIISDNFKVDGIVKVETAIMITDFYVIIIDDVKKFNNIFIKYVLRASAWHPAAKFIILYNNMKIQNKSKQIANDIFKILHKYSATNATLLYATSKSDYEILMLNNYDPKACRQISIEKYGYCLNGQIIDDDDNNNDHIHKHMQEIDLKNCTYNLCSRVAAPFVEPNCTDGIEINLILEMQERLGFKLNSTCETEDRGILENDTWTNLLGKLIDKSCDFIIGGFYPDNEVLQDFWVTDPYLSDAHTWYIARAQQLEPWKGLVMIFKLNTWEAFAFVLLISWLIWFFIGSLLPEVKAHKSLSLTALHTLGVVLGCSVNNQPKLQTLRLFFMALALYGLNVASLYTSNLISQFSEPGYEHQISTLKEVIELGIPFGGPDESKDWFTSDDDKYIYKDYSTADNFEADITNLRLVRNGEQVILLNKMFVLQSTENAFVYGFPRNVFQSQLEIITKKGFPLLYHFNKIIRRFRDAGLFDKINDDFEFNNTILKNIRTPIDLQKSHVILTVHHLSGAFAILIIGWIIAIFGFIFEILTKYFIIPRINKFFGLKIGEIRTSRAQLNASQFRHYEKVKIDNDVEAFILGKNEIRSIRFTPIE